MSTCNRLDLQTLGSQLVMPPNSPITNVDIFRFSFIHLRHILLKIPLTWLVILRKSPTSTSYFSNSTGHLQLTTNSPRALVGPSQTTTYRLLVPIVSTLWNLNVYSNFPLKYASRLSAQFFWQKSGFMFYCLNLSCRVICCECMIFLRLTFNVSLLMFRWDVLNDRHRMDFVIDRWCSFGGRRSFVHQHQASMGRGSIKTCGFVSTLTCILHE
jgi:hypothetical protein